MNPRPPPSPRPSPTERERERDPCKSFRYRGGGETKHVKHSPVSTEQTSRSPVPVRWTSTAPAWPLSLPIFFSSGVPPGAWVNLTIVPFAKVPNPTRLPVSMRRTAEVPVPQAASGSPLVVPTKKKPSSFWPLRGLVPGEVVNPAGGTVCPCGFTVSTQHGGWANASVGTRTIAATSQPNSTGRSNAQRDDDEAALRYIDVIIIGLPSCSIGD